MKEEEIVTITEAPVTGLKRIGDYTIDMPCFVGGKITLDAYEDVATHYVQSFINRAYYAPEV
jgi:hypothetical protein